jgi:hypothetical protein
MAATVACASPVRRPLSIAFAAAVSAPRAPRPVGTPSRPGFLTVLLRALSAAAV